jgi:tripartite-type tricarboxylate transporter receptor subunit TctC
MASPKVPQEKVAAVQAALVNMSRDPEGRKVLQTSADLLKAQGDLGFVAAADRDYDNYRTFYKTTRVKDLTKE